MNALTPANDICASDTWPTYPVSTDDGQGQADRGVRGDQRRPQRAVEDEQGDQPCHEAGGRRHVGVARSAEADGL